MLRFMYSTSGKISLISSICQDKNDLFRYVFTFSIFVAILSGILFIFLIAAKFETDDFTDYIIRLYHQSCQHWGRSKNRKPDISHSWQTYLSAQTISLCFPRYHSYLFYTDATWICRNCMLWNIRIHNSVLECFVYFYFM